jgi:transposase
MGWRSGQSYSQDLRDRVLKAVDGGMPVRQAAPTYAVSIAYIYKALIRRRMTGDAGINSNRGHAPRKLSGAQELALVAHIRSRPGLTLAQAQAWLVTEHGVELSTGAIWNAARRLGLSFKKSPASRRAGPARRGREAQAVESRAAVPRS